jgi:surface carbohydrate biosynthesis protein
MKNSLPLLLLPVETKSREFKSRIYFASIAADYGFKIWIGSSREIHKELLKFPKSIIIENDATIKTKNFARDASNLGHKLIAWDEESISTITNKFYVHQRVASSVIEMYEYFFTRGFFDANEIIKTYPKHKSKIVPAGNPRIDILRHQYNKELQYCRNGPIVIMSRFARSNPFSISREVAADNATKKFNLTGYYENFYRAYLNHCHNIFDLFFPMVKELAEEFHDKEIIIRPHPSEKISTWKDLSMIYKNITIDNSNSAEELAAKASVVIHNGCTTGLEAALLGIPVFSFMPIESQDYDVPLPNTVSRIFKTNKSLFNAIKNLFNEEISIQDNSRRTWEIIDNGCIGNNSGNTSALIILNKIKSIKLKVNLLILLKGFITKCIIISRKLRINLKNLVSKSDKEKASLRQAYYDQKFLPISLSEIEENLRKFSSEKYEINKTILGWWEIRLRSKKNNEKI